jgi:uncharacterized protein (TIGR02246 family)
MSDINLSGLEAFASTDATAIRQTMTLLFDGFRRRDAESLNAVYTGDADWVNAFGSVKKGRTEIVHYLEGLFADSAFNAGRIIKPPISIVRKLTDDTAAVSSHLQIAGQGLVDGGAIALRDNRSLRILQKHSAGRWLVVSEMYMDVRQDKSYVNHS